MDFFDIVREKKLKTDAPLAARMRPKTIDEVVGQEQILSEGKLLYRAIRADKLGSLILYGLPGTGKTTVARIIAKTTKSHFAQLNATNAGKKDIEKVVDDAKNRLGMTIKRTILFIDEIHRFNKAQQDALLPHVEDGTIILIGATTENPYFEVNGALVSRSRIFRLRPLSVESVKTLIYRALEEDEILSQLKVSVDDDAVDFWAEIANGDARAALNALEIGYLTTEPVEDKIHITLEIAEECIQQRAIRYDKDGDNHYDTISAYILSVRGSDPDAAVYYLMRMLYAGEDPKFIARRLIVCASEEVGNADPNALTIAMSAANAVNFIGMPECQYALSQATIYVACAPKSDSVFLATRKALEDVENQQITTIPPHIKDFLNRYAKKLGNGVGYKNAHRYENHYVEQQYLPDELMGRTYYEPSEIGYEKSIKEWMDFIKSNE